MHTPISSDLTLNRILPYINGINSISRIAQLADTDLSLTRRAIQHLVYYGCLVLLDMFSFSAIYALTAEIGGFIIDEEVKEECARYVRVPRLRMTRNTTGMNYGTQPARAQEDCSEPITCSASRQDSLSLQTPQGSEINSYSSPQKPDEGDFVEWHIDHEALITLYTSLRQGLTLKNWVLENLDLLSGIDVRRFITFGIIKGFVYRIHKYAIASTTSLPPAPPTSLDTSAATSVANPRESDTATLRGHVHSGVSGAQNAIQQSEQHQTKHPAFSLHRPSMTTTALADSRNVNLQSHFTYRPEISVRLDNKGKTRERDNSLLLLKFLDGMHCFDGICSDLSLSEKALEERLRSMGEGLAVIVHR